MVKGQLVKWAIAFGALAVFGCAEASMASPETIIVGSTPGDAVIKSMLGIEPDKPVDFIRWHLVLREAEKSFIMSVRYGVGKPNTRDFEGGGEQRTYEGPFEVKKDGTREIYTLTSSKMGRPLSLIKLNADLFHLLIPDNRLMANAGGWGYTLSRQQSSSSRSPALTTFEVPTATPTQEVFVGRTPCQELAKEYKWSFDEECLKL